MKKLYTLLAITLLSINIHAQIIYTDIIPDYTVAAGGTYNLDLNNDGTTDFVIQTLTVSPSCASGCTPLTFSEVIMSPTSTNGIIGAVKPLLYNDSISSQSLTWNTSSNQLIYEYAMTCLPDHTCVKTGDLPWHAGYERYGGLRISSGGHYLYGWVRIEVGGIPAFAVIKDYAYNSMPDSLILAGRMTDGITSNNYNNSGLGISPNPFTYTLSLTGTKANGEAVLYDVMGKEMLRQKTAEGETRLNTEGLAAGVYFISYIEGDRKENIKVVKAP